MLGWTAGKMTGSSPRVRGTRVLQVGQCPDQRFIPARAGNTPGRPNASARWTVHPRACGEHQASLLNLPDATGSSPRVRGTRADLALQPAVGRFIPARAGNTVDLAPLQPAGLGSSPRVRGTQFFSHVDQGRERFIPARAGNTPAACPAGTCPAVHPRACGEHAAVDKDQAKIVGSSPRVRGTRGRDGPHREHGRFIPARAGNTTLHAAPAEPMPVHPRACGEHQYMQYEGYPARGSSPRVRGTPGNRHVGRKRARFIPARAGNTHGLRTGWPPWSVHPRACGEHSRVKNTGAPSAGSSPRVRGTPSDRLIANEEWRFIPARAGNTCPSSMPCPAVAVHPRACGEHADRAAAGGAGSRFIPARAGNTRGGASGGRGPAVHPRACGEHDLGCVGRHDVCGSSPRVRGTRLPGRAPFRLPRFIPARAGNTTLA